jgi:hypothetical protein
MLPAVTTRLCILLSIVLLLELGAARAQTATEPSQSETVNALLERIDNLERRMAELEAGENRGATLSDRCPRFLPLEKCSRASPPRNPNTTGTFQMAAQPSAIILTFGSERGGLVTPSVT